MDVTRILSLFSNKDLIHSLTFSEKMTGVFATICIGMGITFLVLVVIQYLIEVMSIIISIVCGEKKPVKVKMSKEDSEEIKNYMNIIVAITLTLSQQMEEELKLK